MSERVTGVVVVTSGKGGVGKTTTVMNVAGGMKTLGAFAPDQLPADFVLDLDYGGSLTRAYGYAPNSGFAAALLDGRVAVEDALHETEEGVPLVPTDADIGGEPRTKIAAWRDRLVELGRDRLIIVDTSDDILSAAVAGAILAADILAIPVQLSKKAYERTFPEIAGLIDGLEKKPELVWFATMADKRLRVAKQVLKQIADDGVELTTFIPRAAAIDEADFSVKSVVTTQPASPVAGAYQDLASNLYARLRKMRGAAPGRAAGRAPRALPV